MYSSQTYLKPVKFIAQSRSGVKGIGKIMGARS